VIHAGFGFSDRASADDLVAALDLALATHGLDRADVADVAVPANRRDAPVGLDAASALGVGLAVISPEALARAGPQCLTRSERSLAATGVPSAAEAAALAAAGPGGRLLGPRLVHGVVTCALAIRGDA
jgi:cobalt-precorrin 5A hydrolase